MSLENPSGDCAAGYIRQIRGSDGDSRTIWPHALRRAVFDEGFCHGKAPVQGRDRRLRSWGCGSEMVLNELGAGRIESDLSLEGF